MERVNSSMDTKYPRRLRKPDSVTDRRGSIRSWRSFAYIKTDNDRISPRVVYLISDPDKPAVTADITTPIRCD